MLKIQEVSVKLGYKQVLEGISLELDKGKIIGLVAPNGTGKTTLMRTILGMIPFQQGDITIDDKLSIKNKKQKIEMLKHISLLSDQSELFEEFSGLEHLKLFKNIWKSPIDIEEIVTSLNMDSYVKDKVSSYSLGMRQRLCFAMQLASDTDYLLMDEVMNGLDPDNVQLLSDVLQELKAKGKAIMISSHLLENLQEISDEVYFLKAGKIVAEFTEEDGSLREKYKEIYN
jgi:ABC-2 type transport system ATP-binding protein